MNTFHIPEISSSNIQCNYFFFFLKQVILKLAVISMFQNTLLLWSFLLALLDIVSLVCELAFASHPYPVRKKNRLQISR